MRKSLPLLAPLVLVVAACGSSSSSHSTTTTKSAVVEHSSVQITTRTLPGVGTVLVNGAGHTLYVYAPDSAKKVTCIGRCAGDWPPVFLAGQEPATAGQVRPSLLSNDPDPSGGHVVTYAGWPLYLDVDDHSAGTAIGQATFDDGGLWYMISPTGKVITKKVSHGAGTGTPTS